MLSYIVIGHYPVTNSNGMCLKLNYDFSCCKTVILKILQSLKSYVIVSAIVMLFCQAKADLYHKPCCMSSRIDAINNDIKPMLEIIMDKGTTT